MLSPAYSYSAVATKDIFMSREDIRDKFRDAVGLLGKHNLMVSPIYLDFLRGERELDCTAWGTPTYNPRGWKGPCYLITDAHHDSYKDLVEKTDWSKYGPGNDPRCADCMVHVGFETTPVLGARPKLGDTWKMFKWQMSGKMGGRRFVDKNAPPRQENGSPMGHLDGPGATRPVGNFIPADQLGSQDRTLRAP